MNFIKALLSLVKKKMDEEMGRVKNQ